MQASHAWRGDGAVFDEDNLVSHAGLAPLLELAQQTGLSRLLDEHVRFTSERVKSGAANATAKLTAVIAGMAAGADSFDDLDVIRAGGMSKLFGGVYANATLGILTTNLRCPSAASSDGPTHQTAAATEIGDPDTDEDHEVPVISLKGRRSRGRTTGHA